MSCADVIAALSGPVGRMAFAHCCEVSALIPGAQRCAFMVRVRVVPSAAGTMAEAFLGAPSILILGQSTPIFPVAHVRDPLRDLPGRSRARMALHEAARDPATRSRLRRAIHPKS